jgi:hypothetical protein
MTAMVPTRRGLLACTLLIALLVACEPNRAPRLHDVYLFGLEDARLSYVYGLPGTLTLEGGPVTLADGDTGGRFAVPESLLVDGEPYVRTAVVDIAPPARVERIPLTTDLVVRTDTEVPLLVYYDGAAWFTLVEDAEAGLDVRVVPRRRIGRLQGIGALSSGESDAVADALEARGRPIAVALVDPEGLPERTVDGLSEYLLTGLYLQPDVPVDASAYEAPAQDVVWDLLGQGDSASGAVAPLYQLITDRETLVSAWNRANGSALSIPPLPDVDFGRETIVAAFLGERPTGGYRAEVLRIERDDGELFVDLVERTPSADAVTTQALTSPWVMIRVLRSGISVAWFRDPVSGQLYAAARAVN